MATLVSGPIKAVNDLADQLARQLAAGGNGRASLGVSDVAFSWTTGMPPGVANFVNTVTCESLSFNAVIVSPSGTPPALVAEGGTKPTAVTLTSKNVQLKKYAGLGTFSTEDFIGSSGLAAAVTATLVNGAWLAFNNAVVDDLEASAGLTATGATWTEAILGAVGAVATNGSSANLLVMNPADYAGAVTPESGYVADNTTGAPVLFGLTILLSASMTAGSALVLDASAVTCAHHASSPVVVSDVYSGLSTNQCRIAGELFAGSVVSSPGGVCLTTNSAP